MRKNEILEKIKECFTSVPLKEDHPRRIVEI